jgi:hypothetical protein
VVHRVDDLVAQLLRFARRRHEPDLKSGRLILRTAARPDRAYTRSWTFWHGLTLEP